MHIRIIGTILATLITFLLETTPVFAKSGVDPAPIPEVHLQSANYDKLGDQIIVKGKLTGFSDDVPVGLFDVDTGGALAPVQMRNKQFSFKVPHDGGVGLPCAIKVIAGGEVATSDLRHGASICEPVLLTLEGVVRDSPIPYATITITIGDQVFTTVADENGEFTIEIASIDVDSLVIIESSGENPNDTSQVVDMASVTGTFSSLVEDSDGDGIVDATENPNINNTPFTTALFVLVGQASEDGFPQTQEELDAAASQIDGTELLQTAAVIKAIVDGGLAIPEDPATGEPYGSILDFIADAEVDASGNTAIDNFVADNPAAVEEAAQLIVSDPDIVPAFAEEDVPDRYYAIPTAITGFLARNGSMLQFNQGPNTGSFGGISAGGSGGPISKAFDWAINAGQLQLDFSSDPFTNYSTAYGAEWTQVCEDPAADAVADIGCTCADITAAIAANSPNGLQVQNDISGRNYTRIAVSGDTEFVRVYESTHSTFLEGVACEQFSVGTYEAELRNGELTPSLPFTELALTDTRAAMPLYYDVGSWWYGDDIRSANVDLVTFHSTSTNCSAGWNDAGAYFADQPATDSSFDLCWRALGAGESRILNGEEVSREGDLELDYQDGWIQIIRRLDQLGPEDGVFHDFWNTTTLERFGYYDVSVTLDEGLLLTEAALINNPGEFWGGMINGWHPDQYTVDGDGNLNLDSWGWQLFGGAIAYNGRVGSSGPIDGWSILGSDTALDGSVTMPVGSIRLNRSLYLGEPWAQSYSRFWIPLATTTVTDPAYVGGLPGRTRIYVLETELFHDVGSFTNFMFRIKSRLNPQEQTVGSLTE